MISIIIVNYNGKKWLKRLLDSLVSQTYKNYEIIVVDNHSKDDSVSFIKENYGETIRLVISDKNRGFAGGNNLGVLHAKGRYLLFMNTDVWVETNFLEQLWNFYKNHSYDVISPLEADYNALFKGKPYISAIDFLGHPTHLWGDYPFDQSFYLTGSCFFVSRQIYQESYGLDEDFFMYSEEVDWFWRLTLFGKSFSYVSDIFYYHAKKDSAKKISYNIFLWRNENILQMLLKNYAWYNLLWIIPIYFLQNFFEVLFFLVIFRPDISYSYIQGWVFNILHLKKIIEKRSLIQRRRVVSDFQMMKKMYFGFGKIKHLVSFLNHGQQKRKNS